VTGGALETADVAGGPVPLAVPAVAAAAFADGFIGLCLTLWIVRRTTGVGIFGWSATVAGGCELFELSA
jgi:hypothetical protein